MNRKLFAVFAVIAASFFFGAVNLFTAASQTNPLSEGFEAGGKTAYAAANVTLGSGSWYLFG